MKIVPFYACRDCGAAAGTPCTDACESGTTVLVEQVEGDLDGYTGPCCTYPLCPCRSEVA